MVNVTTRFVQFSVEDINLYRRRHLLNIFLGLVALAVVFTWVMSAFFFSEAEADPASLSIYQSGTIMLLGLGLIYLTNRFLSQRLASVVFLLFFVALLAVVDTPQEVIQGRTTFLFVIPILMASAFLQPVASVVVAALIGLILYILAIVTQTPPSFISATAFMLVGVVSWVAAQSLENALHRLQVSNTQLEDSMRELELAQERLLNQEKLSVLGQLAGSVGHELRNPLGVISNAVYFLKMSLNDADDLTKEYLDTIMTRVQEADRIVADLLNLTRTRPVAPEKMTVPELISEALFRHPAPENVTITKTFTSNLPHVLVDKQQIGQVLANLITNAYQAMEQGGALSLSAKVTPSQVCLKVKDSGVGMSEEVRNRIFEPLFTTKAKGIGLGLVVTKNLIEANGGTIAVESEIGEGTTFTVGLPLAN